jgi:signal transduction histidine kinase
MRGGHEPPGREQTGLVAGDRHARVASRAAERVARVLRGGWSPPSLVERLPRHRVAAWVLALALPVLLTLAQRLFQPAVPPATVLFLTLVVVAGAALLGGAGPAFGAIAAGLLTQWGLFGFPYGSLDAHRPAQIAVLVVFVVLAAGIALLVAELTRLTAEQAALKRIGTLVAGGVSPHELFTAVAGEVATLFRADRAVVAQLEAEKTLVVRAAGGPLAATVVTGERRRAEPPLAAATVVATRAPARTDRARSASADPLMRDGRIVMSSSVAAPVLVDGDLWGIVVISSRRPLPADAETRMPHFTELIATAIANAETREELIASRARIVAASDESRRRVERDLHDGVQQRLVTLTLRLRTLEAALPRAASDLRAEIAGVAEGLHAALDELREIARGIHPAVLSGGGLGPALRTLARRSAVPVTLRAHIDTDLSDVVELAAYYVVSELLTNAAKHAQASVVDVEATTAGGVLRLRVHDDGLGGADASHGSGLTGLRDRIEALGGTLVLHSPPRDGTRVDVALPVDGRRSVWTAGADERAGPLPTSA